MSPQGHFLGPWLLLLLLLPSVVVSTAPKKQSVNEAIGSAEKRGSAINGASLIARPEKRPEVAADYRELQRRLQRSLRSGGLELFPVALHQQSTNSAAAKRDLHYKQYGRPARGTVADSRMIEQGKKFAKKRRFPTLAREINGLKSRAEDEADRRIGRRDNHQPPRIVFADAALPEPFEQPTQRERARPFSLANFLVKTRLPQETRSFRPSSKVKSLKSKSTLPTEKDVAEKIKQKKTSTEAPATTTEVTTTELPETTEILTTMKNNATEESDKKFALYYQIVAEDLDDNTKNVPNFEANSIVVETAESAQAVIPMMDSNTQNNYQSDWDTSETLTREIIKEVAMNEEPKRRRQASNRAVKVKSDTDAMEEKKKAQEKYEFGYKVIDHGSGSEFGHAETRQGRMTSGQYHVRLPDGRVQRVHYVVDGVGYHAVVSYERDGTTSPPPTTTRRTRRRPRRRHS